MMKRITLILDYRNLIMIFEFTAAQGFDFITLFGKQIDAQVRDNFLEIPKVLGEGYIRKIGFGMILN